MRLFGTLSADKQKEKVSRGSWTLPACNLVTNMGTNTSVATPWGFRSPIHWSKTYNFDSVTFLLSVYVDNLKSLQKMAFPMKVNIQHSPPLLLFNLSDNPLSKGCLSHHAVQSIWVWKVFCLHKCKVKASVIGCFIRQLQEMTASSNKTCLIDISINVKPSNIISINAGTVPSHALHISDYLFQVISNENAQGEFRDQRFNGCSFIVFIRPSRL